MTNDEDILLKTLADLGGEDVPDGFHSRVMAQIAREKPLFWRIIDKPRGYVSIAACFLAGFIVLSGAFGFAAARGGSPMPPPETYTSSDSGSAVIEESGMPQAENGVEPAAGGGSAPEAEYSGLPIESAKIAGGAVAYAEEAESDDVEFFDYAYNAEIALQDSTLVFDDAAARESLAVSDAVYEMYVSEYSISVRVDDVDAALSALGGYNNYMSALDASDSYAEISLELYNSEVETALSAIRSTGVVTGESFSERSVASPRVDAYATIASKEKEIENVLLMLDKADNIPDMLTLSSRLEQLYQDVDAANGTLNSTAEKSARPVVRVSLTRAAQAPMPEYEQPFGSRVQNALIAGTNATANIIAAVAVGLSRMAAPLAVIAVIAAIAFIIVKISKRGRGNDKKN